MARSVSKQVIKVQPVSFADWCIEVRDLAGDRWPEVAEQCPTLYAVWGGGASPHMIGLILPAKVA